MRSCLGLQTAMIECSIGHFHFCPHEQVCCISALVSKLITLACMSHRHSEVQVIVDPHTPEPRGRHPVTGLFGDYLIWSEGWTGSVGGSWVKKASPLPGQVLAALCVSDATWQALVTASRWGRSDVQPGKRMEGWRGTDRES